MKKSLDFKKESVLISKAPSLLRGWLTHKESFIDRLKEFGVVDPSIRVLEQGWSAPEKSESDLLSINAHENAWVREVLIENPGKQWLFARTIVPKQTLTGKEACLMRLENRSLGSVLFTDPLMHRSEFDIALIRSESDWHRKISDAVKKSLPDLWARRSLFYLSEKPLLLTEVFLPDLEWLRVIL